MNMVLFLKRWTCGLAPSNFCSGRKGKGPQTHNGLCYILMPPPPGLIPNMTFSDLHQWFRWQDSKKPYRGSWDLSQSKGTKIPFSWGDLQQPLFLCWMQWRLFQHQLHCSINILIGLYCHCCKTRWPLESSVLVLMVYLRLSRGQER